MMRQRFPSCCISIVLSVAWRSCLVSGTLLWSDEFDNGLDTDSWNIETGTGINGWGNFELQTYTESNVIVQDDTLQIVVDRDPLTGSFRSGRINTANKVEVLYGKIQARIRVPDVVEGLWPAFWTLGTDFQTGTPWPDCGEIDIMEVGQGLAMQQGVGNNRVISAAHWERNETYVSYPGHVDVKTELHYDYATFTLDWTPDRLTTYINDVEIWKMDIGLDVCGDCEEFHQPHYMVLNVAVGGGFTSGSESSSSAGSSGCGGSSSSGVSGCLLRTENNISAPLPASMIINWVRVFDNGNTTLTSRTRLNTEQPSLAPVDPTNVPIQAPTKLPIQNPTHLPTTLSFFQSSNSVSVPVPQPTTSPTKIVVEAPPLSPEVSTLTADSTQAPLYNPPSLSPVVPFSAYTTSVPSPIVSGRTEPDCPDGYSLEYYGKSGKGDQRGLSAHYEKSDCFQPRGKGKGGGKSKGGKAMAGKGKRGKAKKTSNEEVYSGLAASAASRATVISAFGAVVAHLL